MTNQLPSTSAIIPPADLQTQEVNNPGLAQPPSSHSPFENLVFQARNWADETNLRVAQTNSQRRHRDELHQRVTPNEIRLNELVSDCIKAWRVTGFPAPEVENRVKALAEPTKALLWWELKSPRPVSEDPEPEEEAEAVSKYLCEHRGKFENAVPGVLALAHAATANEGDVGRGESQPPQALPETEDLSARTIAWLEQEWERRDNKNGNLAELYSIPGVSFLQAIALQWWREQLSSRRIKGLIRELAFCVGGVDADWRNTPIDQAAAFLWARRDVVPPINPGQIDPAEYLKALELIHNKCPISVHRGAIEMLEQRSPSLIIASPPSEPTPFMPQVADEIETPLVAAPGEPFPAQSLIPSAPTRQVASDIEQPAPVTQNRFELVGNIWHVQFGNEKTEISDDFDGLRVIARLLEKKHTPISALHLEGHDENAMPQHQTDAPILDRETKDELRTELLEIIDAMKEVAEFEDQTEYQRHAERKKAIDDQLKAAVGLDGKDRLLSQGNEANKAADRVRKALATVYERLIGAPFNVPGLVGHLKASIKKETKRFTYRPNPPEPAWVIRF